MATKFTDLLNADAIRAATRAARDGTNAEVAPPSREQQIADCIQTGFGCHREAVRQLVGLLGVVGELPAPAAQAAAGGVPAIGTLYICPSEDTEPLLCRRYDDDGDAEYTRANGVGSYTSRTAQWSYATDEQIDAFFS